MIPLNERWTNSNRLTEARDRGRTDNVAPNYAKPSALGYVSVVGDVNIDPQSGDLLRMSPRLVQPMIPKMVPPIVRRMGQTTIQQRRMCGNENLWSGTPVEESVSLGDPEIDITDILTGWDNVGWHWDRRTSTLKAYLTTGEKTYTVKFSLKRIQRIFNQSAHANGCPERKHFREATLNGFFKKLGKSLKKGFKWVGKHAKKAVLSPINFVKNPKKFIKDTGKTIKKVVKGVGKVAMKVATSPIFAGVMTAISVIPPIGTAIGGAGLAVYAAANAIKPAFTALDKGIDAIDAIKKGKPMAAVSAAAGAAGLSSNPVLRQAGALAARGGGGLNPNGIVRAVTGGRASADAAVKLLTSKTAINADQMTGRFRLGFDALPPAAKGLMASALKSVDASPLTRRQRRERRSRAILRFSRNRLTRVS